MNVSVLFSTYNRSNILKKTLFSFQELNTANLSWELLVADNANDPETQKILQSYQDKLPLNFIVVTKLGKNTALNQLVKLAQGHLLVFTDDDVTPDKNWLIELWHAAQRWPNDILFGGKIIPLFPPKTPEWIRDPNFDYASVAFAWFDKGEDERPFQECPFGPNMAVRREVFTKYGIYFDENIGPRGTDYPMGSETTGFCRKLKRINERYVYVPNAVVYHRIRPDQVTFKSLLKRAYRFGRGFAAADVNHGCKELCGAPRYLYKKVFLLGIKYYLNFWREEKEKWPLGQQFYFHLGMLKQYRIQSKIYK